MIMSQTDNNPYDKRYSQNNCYWGQKPSALCYEVFKHVPPEKPLSLLDIGCGEGRNTIFLARNGYSVSAFDLGEILTCYHDWEILFFEETVFDCNSSGIHHQHAVNRIVARKVQ